MEDFSFNDEYAKYYNEVLVPTRKEITQITDTWKDTSIWDNVRREAGSLVVPTPIHRIYSRIKRPESVEDKIYRKPNSFPDGLTKNSIKKMSDTIGVRIVTFFFEDLLLVHKLLLSEPRLRISSIDPPKAYLNQSQVGLLGMFGDIQVDHKDSGYLSIHYIVQLVDSCIPEENRPWFEIQLRTIIEEAWGEIEHQLGYKPEKKTTLAVRKQFKIITSYLSAVDEHFDFLRYELQYLQQNLEIESRNPLNAENLPSILHENNIIVSRRELDGLLKLLFSRGITTVAEFQQVATPGNLTLIDNRYFATQNRLPSTFEKIANLANMKDCNDIEILTQRIDAQIDLNNTWLQLRSYS
ncbi:MAG: hypothetical protein FWH40_09755 [Coriobacteriia bacterium]|nr:hypothetical protein [Coriobacteriia bacterium]